jgi:phage terminase large subunit-like protein
VIEVNQGGDMVAHTLRTVDPTVRIIEVRASRGKHVRAEPIASRYERGEVAHVGSFVELENQMTQMTLNGYEGPKSPDRVDALVWLMSALFPAVAERPKAPPIQIAPRPALGAGRRF